MAKLNDNENNEILKRIIKQIEDQNKKRNENLSKNASKNDSNTSNRFSKNEKSMPEMINIEEASSSIPQKKVSLEDLKYKKGIQNLDERKKLINVLGIIFAIQLFFMNIIVGLIVSWSIFNFPCFHDINTDLLNILVDLSKYYVTAILVELLGGIIYIVHNVFKDTTIDQ